MKNRMTRSILSFFVLGVFGLLAIGYQIGWPNPYELKTRDLGDGLIEEEIAVDQPSTKGDTIQVNVVSRGKQKDGLFIGDVTIEERLSEDNVLKREICKFIGGQRHGKSLVFLKDDPNVYWHCYDMGRRIPCSGISNSGTRGTSAFDILDYEYPWFILDENPDLAKMMVESYMDAIEDRLANQQVEPLDFDNYYNDVIDSMEMEGNFTWQEKYLQVRYLIPGLSVMKYFPYRLAMIDRYQEGLKPSGQIVKERYPSLELDLKLFGATDEDLSIFFTEFDNWMAADGPLDPLDPLFADSINKRMYRVMAAFLEDGFTSPDIQQFQAPPFNGSNRPEKLKTFLLGSDGLVASPADNSDMAFAMAILMAVHYDSGDPVRAAVRKAWFANHQEPMPPTLVSQLVDDPATAGIEMRGHIYEDGGADVLERGFVWDTTYLPDLEKAHVVALGSGTGEFTTVLNGLEVGKRYFARGYAVNQGGVAYGNLFEFTVQEISSVDGVDHRVTFHLFPNPVRSELFLRMEDIVPGPVQIRVSDLQGRIVREEILGDPGPDGTVRLDVSALPQGAYLLQVRSDGRLGAQRFIKER